MKTSVTDKIDFYSGLGVREPRSLPRGERTRARSGAQEKKAGLRLLDVTFLSRQVGRRTSRHQQDLG